MLKLRPEKLDGYRGLLTLRDRLVFVLRALFCD
jgi:hypothetical protein